MCLCLCVCVCITQFRPTCQKFSFWKRFQTWTKVSVCGSPRPRCAVLFWFNTGCHVSELTSLGYATNELCCSIFFYLQVSHTSKQYSLLRLSAAAPRKLQYRKSHATVPPRPRPPARPTASHPNPSRITAVGFDYPAPIRRRRSYFLPQT